MGNDPADKHAAFVLLPVDTPKSRDNMINDGVFLRLQSAATHECVRPLAGKDGNVQVYQRSNVNHTEGTDQSLSNRMQGLKWDDSHLVVATTAEKENDSDCAFHFTLVDLEQVSYTNFVSGVTPILRFYCDTREQRELSHTETEQVLLTLDEIRDFVYDDTGVRQKCRQKLFRGLQLIDLLIKMLEVPFQPHNKNDSGIKVSDVKKHPYTERVANAVFRVLKAYLDGQSRKNEEYMAQHIPYLYTLVGGLLDVEPLFAELFRDNENIVSQISDHEMDTFIKLLVDGDHDPDYLTILNVFCTCNNTPNRYNQKYIADKLLGENSTALFSTSYEVLYFCARVRLPAWREVGLSYETYPL